MSTLSMYTPPVVLRGIGCTRLCAVEFGGVPTAATTAVNAPLQAVLNALPAAGGTVHLPPGTYWIDTTQPLRPKSRTRLSLDTGAFLRALPGSASRSQLLLLQDITDFELVGGQLIGERDQHTYLSASTDEWNHAVAIYGAQRISLLQSMFSDFTGDGVSIGRSPATGANASDVFIDQVVASNNRRQGLSLVSVDGGLVCRSQFINTHGTRPECGIDIEPEKTQSVRNVRIVACTLSGNAKYNLNVLERMGDGPTHGQIANVSVEQCDVHHAGSNGIVCDGGITGLTLAGNIIHDNSATGMVLTNGAGPTVVGNTFVNNYARNPPAAPRKPFDLAGVNSSIQRDILPKSGAYGPGITTGVGLNHYA